MTFATILDEKRKKTNKYIFKHENKLNLKKKKNINKKINE